MISCELSPFFLFFFFVLLGMHSPMFRSPLKVMASFSQWVTELALALLFTKGLLGLFEFEAQSYVIS